MPKKDSPQDNECRHPTDGSADGDLVLGPATIGAVLARLWVGLARAQLEVPPGKLLTSDQPWGLAAFCIGLTFPFVIGAAAVAIRFALRDRRRPSRSTLWPLWRIAALPAYAIVIGVIVLLGFWFLFIQAAWGWALLVGLLTVQGGLAGPAACAVFWAVFRPVSWAVSAVVVALRPDPH